LVVLHREAQQQQEQHGTQCPDQVSHDEIIAYKSVVQR
jgi:hypothetical protein